VIHKDKQTLTSPLTVCASPKKKNIYQVLCPGDITGYSNFTSSVDDKKTLAKRFVINILRPFLSVSFSGLNLVVSRAQFFLWLPHKHLIITLLIKNNNIKNNNILKSFFFFFILLGTSVE